MGSLPKWFRYAEQKLEYSFTTAAKKRSAGLIEKEQLTDDIWRTMLRRNMTFLHRNEGEEMAPAIAGKEGCVLVRNILCPVPTTMRFHFTFKPPFFKKDFTFRLPPTERQVFVGDVVMLHDPEDPEKRLIRRLAAIEGYEMASKDDKDEPFVLKKAQCWVLSDNVTLKPKEARDSRILGPVPMRFIIGRVIYSLSSAVEHGPVINSDMAMEQDSPVLAVELDIKEMTKFAQN